MLFVARSAATGQFAGFLFEDISGYNMNASSSTHQWAYGSNEERLV